MVVDVCSHGDRAEVLFKAWNWGKELPIYSLLGLSELSHFVKSVVPESTKIVGRSLIQFISYPKTFSPVTSPVHYWYVRPEVDKVKWFDFHRVEECIQAGEIVGRQVACQIKALLEQKTLRQFMCFTY